MMAEWMPGAASLVKVTDTPVNLRITPTRVRVY
jgi:hypothetical protein